MTLRKACIVLTMPRVCWVFGVRVPELLELCLMTELLPVVLPWVRPLKSVHLLPMLMSLDGMKTAGRGGRGIVPARVTPSPSS
jgi:hypothetical protein